MRTLTFAALFAGVALSAAPVEAGRLGNGGQQVQSRSMSTMQSRSGSWSGSRQVQSSHINTGNWNGPRPQQPGNWNNPRPQQPGNWNNNPRPQQPGNWNNNPRPNPGSWTPRPNQPHGQPHGSRWGNKIGGHWYAGDNAPGGWNGYRRPVRGWTLPSYWIAPSYYITDYSSYGLSAPPYGYNWTRYYDDAVLMDQRGQVWDSVSGLDWDRYDNGYGYDGYGDNGDDGYYADGAQGGYYDGGQGYQPGYQQDGYQRRDNGVGGAVIGGVAGGVAGNLIAGRGNRTAGTLIGAGVGAVAGYAIDKNEDRGRRGPPPQGYGAGYPQPPVVYGRPGEVVQGGYSNGYQQQGGYVSGGYWYPPATTTTVTVSQAPAQITTTTEYIDTVTYTAPRKTYAKKKVWRPTKVRQCTCACRC